MVETPIDSPEAAATPEPPAPAIKRRAPRRPSVPDAVLAAAVDVARLSILENAEPGQVGVHLGAFPEAERLVTHRFEARLPGYPGWQWYATLARVPRGKEATICETGLLPSGDSLLAPPWVPWSDRVRPEDSAATDGAEPISEPAGEARTESDLEPAGEAGTSADEPAEAATPTAQ